MKLQIKKSRYVGKLVVPPSKSYSHRYLIGAMLSNCSSEIKNVTYSDDILATLNCMKTFGCNFKTKENSVLVENNDIFNENPIFHCKESGSTLRFFIPIALTRYKKVTFEGSTKLIERGIEVYQQIFNNQDIKILINDNQIFIEGELKGGEFFIPGNLSSQYISGLLFALPLVKEDSIINLIPPINSRNYIEMTLDVLNKYQINYTFEQDCIKIKGNQKYLSKDFTIEGDYSNASFLDALNYLNNDIKIIGLNTNSLQGDKIYIEYFKKMNEGNCELDISNCIDLAPILMVFASLKNGVILKGTNRLKIKESSRGEAMKEELNKIGVKVDVLDDSIIVHKSSLSFNNVIFSSHNDHRIAMALSIFSSLFDIEIDGYESVNKSYPNYFDDLISLGGKIFYD